MKLEDYFKYYIQGSDHYLMPKDIFEELFNDYESFKEESKLLKIKYDKVLTMLANHYSPCELDGFMDNNTDYCSMNCGVDEEVFKECWNRYIEQKVRDIK